MKDYTGFPFGVFLTVKEFKNVLKKLEGLEDIKEVDAHHRRADKVISFNKFFKKIKSGLVNDIHSFTSPHK